MSIIKKILSAQEMKERFVEETGLCFYCRVSKVESGKLECGVCQVAEKKTINLKYKREA